jgi:lipopolysaccharide export system permease protein
MAYNTEIAAILSSGVSLTGYSVPYFISALFLTLMTFSLSNWVIPHSTARRCSLKKFYYHGSPREVRERNIHKQVEPGVFIYLESFNTLNNTGEGSRWKNMPMTG